MAQRPVADVEAPIGMFDSGFGGLTVARALIDLMPAEDLVYLGDTGRYPYGPRDLSEVRAFSAQIARLLVGDYGIKMLVVACNTASAAGLEELRKELAIPVLGVIEPGVRAATRATTGGGVGVIGTVGTIASGAYQRVMADHDPGVKLTCAACPGFVEFVEQGDTSSDQVHVLAERLLSPLRQAQVDTLLLGCTHYPFLARTIGDVMGRGVVLVSSADETAFEVKRVLDARGMSRPRAPQTKGVPVPEVAGKSDGRGSEDGGGGHMFLSSGDASRFAQLGGRLFGPELDRVIGVEWD
ncbi:MAG: glutamate racemase [Acidimicrobiales bacterium]